MSTLAEARVSDVVRPAMIDAGVVAEALGVSRATVISWANHGRVRAMKVGRTVRFPRDVLDDLLACRQTT